MNDPIDHHARILDQFTRQAEPFAEYVIHSQEESLVWLAEELRLERDHSILDAGSGPGIVATFLAPRARLVTCLDATPAMLETAARIAREKSLENLEFVEGTFESLPFSDGSFDGVVTRYTFHHLLDTRVAMAELVRVTKPGGRVVVCDAAPRPDARDRYDAWEKMRDPSHTSARTVSELVALGSGLEDVSIRHFRVPTELEKLVASSFPREEDRATLARLMAEDVGKNELDFNARDESGVIYIAFPITIVSGTKPNG